jgi:hypothetical protein
LLLIQMMTGLRKNFKTWTQLLGKTWSWYKWPMPGLKLTCRKQQFQSALQELVCCPEPITVSSKYNKNVLPWVTQFSRCLLVRMNARAFGTYGKALVNNIFMKLQGNLYSNKSCSCNLTRVTRCKTITFITSSRHELHDYPLTSSASNQRV